MNRHSFKVFLHNEVLLRIPLLLLITAIVIIACLGCRGTKEVKPTPPTFTSIKQEIINEYNKALRGERLLYCVSCSRQYPVYYSEVFKRVFPTTHRIPHRRDTCPGSFEQARLTK
tara:strand:+ start:41 stop:385 length:345 start_codon:yes stop_codon:yes gene_type:complete